MANNEIRLLTADEIDVRVAQTISRDGIVKVNLLLYKDARVDMKILDELYGPMGWQRTHQLIGDRLYCTIEVRDPETGEWIAKQDVGTESNTEPEKGQASDAFKRAGFNWGIGRELYTAPKIQVILNKNEYRDAGGRIQVWATFSVSQIAYNAEREISRLVIVDEKGQTRYELGAKDTRKATAGKTTKAANIEKTDLPDGCTPAIYWGIVRAYGDGKPTQKGGDYRAEWIENFHPTDKQIAKFDEDVAGYKAAQSGEVTL